MQQYFATAGYRVEFAQHGGDALTLVQHDPPDLVLLDLMMPGMNGVEVLQRILALRATLPVIIVTARADATLAEQTRALGAFSNGLVTYAKAPDATLAEQTRALGAFAYVTKPFEFTRVVGAALTRSGDDTGSSARPMTPGRAIPLPGRLPATTGFPIITLRSETGIGSIDSCPPSMDTQGISPRPRSRRLLRVGIR